MLNYVEIGSDVIIAAILLVVVLIAVRTVKSLVKTVFVVVVAILVYCYTQANPSGVWEMITSFFNALGFSIAL